MKPRNRAALSLVPDEPDQVPRLERFRSEHHEVIILLKGTMPTAYVVSVGAWLAGVKAGPGLAAKVSVAAWLTG